MRSNYVVKEHENKYTNSCQSTYKGFIANNLFSKRIENRGADKSLARPGRKQATATEDFDFHISYL